MITKLTTGTTAPESKGFSLGGVIFVALLAAAAYFGYKHYTKQKEEQNH